MSDDLELAIIDLLEQHYPVQRSRLSPASRLLHDLGVDGDDAAELFQRIHDIYGTDFTALGEQWHTFFNNEGPSALLWWWLNKIFPNDGDLRPVTIAGLADIVRQGAWPGDPTRVG